MSSRTRHGGVSGDDVGGDGVRGDGVDGDEVRGDGMSNGRGMSGGTTRRGVDKRGSVYDVSEGMNGDDGTIHGVQLNHVSRRYGKKYVLDDINLTVSPAEVFGLLGPSGSGKTTLVKLIAGIDKPSRGTVLVYGTRMPRLDMLRKIGYMAQSDALYTELSARENLDFFAALFGLSGKEKRRRIREVMELVDLTSHLKQPVSQFSGGMKRRLSLAITLLHRPKLLILDEPTVGIDPLLRASVWNELHAMSQAGTTIIVTTHVMDEAEKCHRLGMIREGRLIATGSPTELKQHAHVNTLEEAFLAFGEGQP